MPVFFIGELMIKDYNGIIIDLSDLNDLYYILKIKIDTSDHLGFPGQFYEIKRPDSNKLRVPISIFNVENNIVSFLIKIVGEGTKMIHTMSIGNSIQLLGPLGNVFSNPESDKNNLLISGGVGYAPLAYLKNYYKNSQFVFIHGGRNQNEIFDADIVYTDDGSKGIKGFVTTDLIEIIEKYKIAKIYTCGPKVMMKKIVELALPMLNNIEVSLEEYMACGLGVCYGCVTKIKNGDDFIYKTVCKDGPIFKGSEVIWDE